MSDSSTGKQARTPGRHPDLVELRRIILGPETIHLRDLKRKLEDPEAQVETLSRILPRAVQLRNQKDRELSTALSPTVERVIEESVRKNPNVLVRALFPIMGPMIRASVASALRSMMESVSRTLDQSLSPSSVKWRIESWQTGRPFSEVVLLHSLKYRVEQVFLIHKETGLLLQHVVAQAVESQDPSLVSAMLRAIQDFVEDSFRVSRSEALEELQFGDLGIWIEEGPLAVLAAVIRGSAPMSLREDLERILELIHLEYGKHLEDLPDDTDLFQPTETLLSECLQTGFRSDHKRKGISPLFWAIVAIVALLVGAWLFFTVRERLRWNDFVARLEAEPGIVVTRAERQWRGYEISGIRDPLSAVPSDIARESGLDVNRVFAQWESYYALAPALVLRRAGALLNPPDTVTLKLEEGTLILEGYADPEWIADMERRAFSVPGVTRVELGGVTQASFENLRKLIEQIEIDYEASSGQLRESQTESLQRMTTGLRSLLRLARLSGNRIHLEIIGETDSTGSWERNRQLAARRAEALRQALSELGFSSPEIEVSVTTRPGLSQDGRVLDDSSKRAYLRVTLEKPTDARADER